MQRDGGPGGAGGAGNPTGGAFTGPAETLELVGDFCYSYSGPISDAGSGSAATTTNKFTTGNYVTRLKIMWAVDSVGTDAIYFDVFMNGSNIIKLAWDGAPTIDSPPPYFLVIPSYTEVEAKWGRASGTKNMCVLMTGRIYRG